jgi:hypothetical protein
MTFIKPTSWWSLALAFAVGLCLCGCGPSGGGKSAAPPKQTAKKGATNAVTTASAPAAAAPVRPLSVFEDRPESGRDPFFPASERRMKVASAQTEMEAARAKPQAPLSSYLKLSAIWPNKARPLAMINKAIFSPGERGEVVVLTPAMVGTSAVHRVSIRCLEIRRDSVLISVEGESGTKELRSPDRP